MDFFYDMAKIKSKKAIQTTKEALNAILQAHGIDLDESVKEPLLCDIIEYLNNVYKPDNKAIYWSQIVAQYVSYYEALIKEKPAFNGMQAMALKKLSKLLMDRYLAANKDGIWNLETCLRQHQIFYDAVCTLDFYRRSFTVALCYNSFDSITAQLSAKKRKVEALSNDIINE